MLISMVSAKHSPGVTTAAALLWWSWPAAVRVEGRRSLLVEADPAGGDVLLDLYDGGASLEDKQGLLALAVEARYGLAAAQVLRYTLPIDDTARRLLLPGLTNPSQVVSLRDTWPQIADALQGLPQLDPATDVIADCGRLGAYGPPADLIRSSDLVLLVLRPTLRDIAAALPRAHDLATLFPPPPAGPDLGVLVVGPGPYGADEVATQLGLPLVGALPVESKAVGLGARVIGQRGHDRSSLGRAAHQLAAAIATQLAARAATVGDRPAAESPAALPPAPPPGIPVPALPAGVETGWVR